MSRKVRLLLARHGETVANVNAHIVSGRSNETPLTPRGNGQAEQLGLFIATQGIRPREAYASPAVRTRDTGRTALRAAGLELELQLADELQELDQGEWVGRPRAEVYNTVTVAEIERLGKDFHAPGGESMNTVGDRVFDWAQTAIPPDDELDWSDGDPTFIAFTHGVAIKCLASRLEDWTETQTYQTPIDNASLSEFVRIDGQWHVAYLNRTPE